jgi:hypothetical protein
MTQIKKAPGAKLKEIIHPDSICQQLIEIIVKRIEDDKANDPIEEAALLGKLVWPFTGMQSPAICSTPDPESPGCKEILQSIIVHFASSKNIEQLPKNCRTKALDYLYYVQKMMDEIAHAEILFHYSNLFLLEGWQTMTSDQKKDFIQWYM